MKKTLQQLSLEDIISLQETDPDKLEESRQASMEYIESVLAPYAGQVGRHVSTIQEDNIITK